MKTITPTNYPQTGNIVLPNADMKRFMSKVFPNYDNFTYRYTYCRLWLHNNEIKDVGEDHKKFYLRHFASSIYNYRDSTIVLTKRK
jgi:hypothetical protein